jgi:hypothetical protein
MTNLTHNFFYRFISILYMFRASTAIPVRETDDRISAEMAFVDLCLWKFKFHFGSVLRIINLE